MKEIRSLSAKRRKRYFERLNNQPKGARDHSNLFSSDEEDLDLSASDLLRHQRHQSLTSEELSDIKRYFDQKKCLKNLRYELAETKSKMKEVHSNSSLKHLFLKTLEKLWKYKTENRSMHDKIDALRIQLE